MSGAEALAKLGVSMHEQKWWGMVSAGSGLGDSSRALSSGPRNPYFSLHGSLSRRAF